VPIDAITPMNEPRSLAAWPGAAFLPADQIGWLTGDLAPALAAAGLDPEIYGLDDTSATDAATLLDSPAAPLLSGIAFHCYQGMDQLTALHDADPTEPIILDECSPGIIPYSAAEVAIDATRNWAKAVALWNLALDPTGGPVQPPDHGCGGCSGVITVSESTHTASFGLNYFQFGQISRYVSSGAVRIASTRPVADFASPAGYGVTAGLDDVAFQNPNGSTVLVAYDNARTPVRMAIVWDGRSLTYRVPARATVTFIWR
jgi:O-glycosyl hydrolase